MCEKKNLFECICELKSCFAEKIIYKKKQCVETGANCSAGAFFHGYFDR